MQLRTTDQADQAAIEDGQQDKPRLIPGCKVPHNDICHRTHHIELFAVGNPKGRPDSTVEVVAGCAVGSIVRLQTLSQ
ncbi:hypothetical protein IL306_008841 [Fusarium sp. DS 682]|nr:hypothetical protein IL306_008841 [Fusarium sp. DS 682]